jgi:DNA processing protein
VASRADAEREIERAAKKNTRIITPSDAGYPPLLKSIADRPAILYVRGDTATVSARCVAIVGSRSASINAMSFTRKTARALSDSGWTIVSGMAIGIDAQAHIGALSSLHPYTAAVLAGGADVIYPRENAKLYDEISEKGAVISEMPMGCEPAAHLFPRRNRIVSGMCAGVLVAEAGLRSGSLITARLAGEQGREVMAVPNFPTDPRSLGANKLIKEGATLVCDAADAMNALDGFKGARAPEPQLFVAEQPVEFKAAEGLEDRILSLLGPTPTGLDALIRELDAPIAQASFALLNLELAEKISYGAAGSVSLKI